MLVQNQTSYRLRGAQLWALVDARACMIMKSGEHSQNIIFGQVLEK